MKHLQTSLDDQSKLLYCLFTADLHIDLHNYKHVFSFICIYQTVGVLVLYDLSFIQVIISFVFFGI